MAIAFGQRGLQLRLGRIRFAANRRPQPSDQRILDVVQAADRGLAIRAGAEMAGQCVRLFVGEQADGILEKRLAVWAACCGHCWESPV